MNRFIVSLSLIAALGPIVAQAELISAEDHKTWVKSASEQCRKNTNIVKSTRCEKKLRKERVSQGLYRGTAEYVETQYSSMNTAEIQEQIDLAKKAQESAPYPWDNEYGNLSKNNYQIEIETAIKLLEQKGKDGHAEQ